MGHGFHGYVKLPEGNLKFHPRFWFGNMVFGKVVGTSMDILSGKGLKFAAKWMLRCANCAENIDICWATKMGYSS